MVGARDLRSTTDTGLPRFAELFVAARVRTRVRAAAEDDSCR
jgi:hypothetical protein